MTLLNLLAAVALLVWGTHMIRRDILNVFGGDLRRVLSGSVGNRFLALAAGLGVTGLLQSSTATALLTTSFASQGLITVVPALAIMLGADIGTALISVVLSIDLSWLSPLLIFVGVVTYLPRQNSRVGRIGRILIGLGLILLSLQLIMLATRPLTTAAGVKVIFATLTGDTMLDMVVGAVFSVLSFSSLAVVLLTSAFAGAKLISVQVALGLVLGANLGSGLLGMLNSARMASEAQRVTLGNLLFKVAGVLLVLPFVPALTALFAEAGIHPTQAPVLFHLAFNVVLAALFVFATEPVGRFVMRMIPDRPGAVPESVPRHLDPAALDTPALAIGCATRESMRIADAVESMLQGLLQVIRTDDRDLALRIRETDDVVDKLYTAVKLYLTQISRGALEDAEGRRWADIVSFTINMEQIGDIIERMVKDLEDRKIAKGLRFSDAGLEEICDLHGRLLANLRLGTTVFLHGDVKSAQQLLAEKVMFRELERAYADSHLDRLSGNTRPSIETSALHLDLLSAMKRINSHICSVAYPILDEAGLLQRRPGREPGRPYGLADAEQPPLRDTDASGDESWTKQKPRPA